MISVQILYCSKKNYNTNYDLLKGYVTTILTVIIHMAACMSLEMEMAAVHGATKLARVAH